MGGKWQGEHAAKGQVPRGRNTVGEGENRKTGGRGQTLVGGKRKWQQKQAPRGQKPGAQI